MSKNIKRANKQLEETMNKIRKEKLKVQNLRNKISREKKRNENWWACEMNRRVKSMLHKKEKSDYFISLSGGLMLYLFCNLNDDELKKAISTYSPEELREIHSIISNQKSIPARKSHILSCIQSHLES